MKLPFQDDFEDYSDDFEEDTESETVADHNGRSNTVSIVAAGEGMESEQNSEVSRKKNQLSIDIAGNYDYSSHENSILLQRLMNRRPSDENNQLLQVSFPLTMYRSFR